MLVPMLAKQAEVTSLTSFIDDTNWVMEQKLDGHRILLCSPGGNYPPTALTRAGTPYTRKLPKAIQDFRFPEGNGAMDLVLDGELVGDTFYVFDMIAQGVVDTSLPLRLRRKVLEDSFGFWAEGNPNIKLVPQAKTKDEKIALAEKALQNNFEGLLLKRSDSQYIPGGRTDLWLKVKFVSTCDVFVLDVRDDGKESVKLGMVEYDQLTDHPQIIDVGRASLIGKEKSGAINVGDVLEVRYLYTGAGGRLYQPTIMRKRDDKAQSECTTDQLKFVNKAVLEAL